jgi:hypothetical protein
LLILEHFKHCALQIVPSTGDLPFPTFLQFFKCFLESTFCDGAQFSYRILLNLLEGLEATKFQSGFKFGKQEQVCWGEVRRIVWMGHKGRLVFCQITAVEERSSVNKRDTNIALMRLI